MTVVFRVDASLRIGSGHLMRCLSLARALQRHGAQCRFIIRQLQGNLINRIISDGFEVVELPMNNNSFFSDSDTLPWLETSWTTDAKETAAYCRDQPDWLVVDHYGLDDRWESFLRPYFRNIMAIDDLADRNHDCDILLDQNLVAGMNQRYKNRVPQGCKCLLGPRYTLLQSAYKDYHNKAVPRVGFVRRLLVYFGGADIKNLTGRTLKCLLDLEIDSLNVDIVSNPYSPFHNDLIEIAKEYSNIRIHGTLESLAPLMLNADIAIGASGATSWERLCLGLPSLVATLSDNQVPIAEELHSQRLVHWIGRADQISDKDLTEAIERAISKPLDPEWSLRCLQMVDGSGADLVASILSLDPTTPLKLRRATNVDETLIFEWVNDAIVRNSSFNSDYIDLPTHKNWFQSKLRNPQNCRYFIVQTEHGLPVGQVRFEKSGEEWEIHFALSPFTRGKGLGLRMLELALATFEDTPNEKVIGRVKPDNTPSCRIFQRLGFRGSEFDGQIVYERP